MERKKKKNPQIWRTRRKRERLWCSTQISSSVPLQPIEELPLKLQDISKVFQSVQETQFKNKDKSHQINPITTPSPYCSSLALSPWLPRAWPTLTHLLYLYKTKTTILVAQALNKLYEGLITIWTKVIKGKGAWYWIHLEPILIRNPGTNLPKAVKLKYGRFIFSLLKSLVNSASLSPFLRFGSPYLRLFSLFFFHLKPIHTVWFNS